MFPSIQHLTMYPYPVYELSFVKGIQKFESTVRPTNSLRRIEYVDYLFLTTNFLMNVNLFNYFNRKKYNLRSKLKKNDKFFSVENIMEEFKDKFTQEFFKIQNCISLDELEDVKL